jgi:hypothetical protein
LRFRTCSQTSDSLVDARSVEGDPVSIRRSSSRNAGTSPYTRDVPVCACSDEETESGEEAMTERLVPAEARWLALGLNVLLLLVEALFLIPRWVGEEEIAMVS